MLPVSRKEHAACGVVSIVASTASRWVVEKALEFLKQQEHRAGETPDGVGDGAGLTLFSLPTEFFKRKFFEGEFDDVSEEKAPELIDGKYAVGHYFLSHNPAESDDARRLIREEAKKQGLKIAGWRNVIKHGIDDNALSPAALRKRSAMWQAVFVPEEANVTQENLEKKLFDLGVKLENLENTEKQCQIDIISQSSRCLVYKGMVLPENLDKYFLDLQAPDMTASTVNGHERYSTNSGSSDKAAQPIGKIIPIVHNGEHNSVEANDREVNRNLDTISADGEKGFRPNKRSSDTDRFSTDITNQVFLHGLPIEEVFVRLMPPNVADSYSPEVKAMLACFRLERTPYNGPAFAANNNIVIDDSMGLRPARVARVRKKDDGSLVFITCSEDMVDISDEYTILQKFQLEPGGMAIFLPKEGQNGRILRTTEILEMIAQRYHDMPNNDQEYFQKRLNNLSATLPEISPEVPDFLEKSANEDYEQSNTIKTEEQVVGKEPSANIPRSLLQQNRQFISLGIDNETKEYGVLYMAQNGAERVMAMGDDTDFFKSAYRRMTDLFVQLFVQITAPAIDSIREQHLFKLNLALGPTPELVPDAKVIPIDSPIMSPDVYRRLEHLARHPEVRPEAPLVHILDTCIEKEPNLTAAQMQEKALCTLLKRAEELANEPKGGVLILSNEKVNANHWAIPDVLAVAAVRQHLEDKKLSHRVSIGVSTLQSMEAHDVNMLLTNGAKFVYPKGACEIIRREFTKEDAPSAVENYCHALEKNLRKTMGKVGIIDVINYINGRFCNLANGDLTPEAGEKRDLSEKPSLAGIFAGLYSPLKGITLEDVANHAYNAHQMAYQLDDEVLVGLPRSGFYIPEKDGIKHGFGPEVVGSVQQWLSREQELRRLYRLDQILCKKGLTGLFSTEDRERLFSGYTGRYAENKEGFYDPSELEKVKQSPFYRAMSENILLHQEKNPIAIIDRAKIRLPEHTPELHKKTVQTTEDIRKNWLSGAGISLGSNTPNAVKARIKGTQKVGVPGNNGEGGALKQVDSAVERATIDQIASGRFSTRATSFTVTHEGMPFTIEIKISQGAKPGEGGELSGEKVTVDIAALRGGLNGMSFISPPPHHDIYSIEDFKELCYDLKRLNPQAQIDVKLAAEPGIGPVAVGVAKTGLVDSINIASNSGGTGAAQQSSIKQTGYPSELGLMEVDLALRESGLRELVKLKVSGGFKTGYDVVKAAILGAQGVEIGTMSLLMLGCRMLRTCNKSCQPGVTTNNELFKGDSENLSAYFVYLAAEVQEILEKLGVSDLKSLNGRFDLLDKGAEVRDIFDVYEQKRVDVITRVPPLTPYDVENIKAKQNADFDASLEKENQLIHTIHAYIEQLPKDSDGKVSGVFESNDIHLTNQDRAFGARIAGEFAAFLEQNPDFKLTICTSGIAGESYGFMCPQGVTMCHTGWVEDGCFKSATGGEFVLKTPPMDDNASYLSHENTVAGHVFGYGARDNCKIFVDGCIGNRGFVLVKNGVQAVVGGDALDFFGEYMTGGTLMLLGKAGDGAFAGASGGVAFLYHENDSSRLHDSDWVNSPDSIDSIIPYESAIREMLQEFAHKSGSQKAKTILDDPNWLSHFQVVIPKQLERINTIELLSDVLRVFQQAQVAMTLGVEIWFAERVKKVFQTATVKDGKSIEEFLALLEQENVLSCCSKWFKYNLCPELKRYIVHVRRGFETQAIETLSVRQVHPKPFETASSDVRLNTYKKLEQEGENADLTDKTVDPKQHILEHAGKLGEGCSNCSAPCACAVDPLSADEKNKSIPLSPVLTQDANYKDTACPGKKPIPHINAELQYILKHLQKSNKNWATITEEAWRHFFQAFFLQTEATPFIVYTGAACPAPCQGECSEGIPWHKLAEKIPNIKRGGKYFGESVHIRENEFLIDMVARMFHLYTGANLTEKEMSDYFGPEGHNSQGYQAFMTVKNALLKNPLFAPPTIQRKDKKLIVVGSGPAGMEIAWRGIRDGLDVEVYEKSNRLGGLLADGIPDHKFDKACLAEDWENLKAMGVKVHINQEVTYNSSGQLAARDTRTNESKIIAASLHSPNVAVALCTGAYQPRTLPEKVTEGLSEKAKKRLIQAKSFLKAVNDVVAVLKTKKSWSREEIDSIFTAHFGEMDPRGKSITLIGGGDTAQDIIRDTARIFTYYKDDYPTSQLKVLVRGSKSGELSDENGLRDEELAAVEGDVSYSTEPVSMIENADGTINILTREATDKYAALLDAPVDPNDAEWQEARELYKSIRSKPKEYQTGKTVKNNNVVILALGNDTMASPLETALQERGLENVVFAGDVVSKYDNTQREIIISAQVNAANTYKEKLREILNLDRPAKLSLLYKNLGFMANRTKGAGEKLPVNLKSANEASKLSKYRMDARV